MLRENIWEGLNVNPPLTTVRLLLEPVTASHAGALMRALADPLVWRYTEEEPPGSEAQYASDLAWLEAHRNADGFMLNLQWVATLRGSGEAIGYVGATVGTPWGRRVPARLAWMFGPEWWGRGYALEAASEMMRFLREPIGVTFFRARIDARNKRSIRLAEGLGLVEAARWEWERWTELSCERDETPSRRAEPDEDDL